jgi:hypothetical protein
MKNLIAMTLGLPAAVLVTTAGNGLTQQPPPPAELSSCLTGASLQVTANPANLVLGESSVVSWSAHLPAGCSTVKFHFNGGPVAATGSQRVSPSVAGVFRLTASLTRSGVSQQVSATTNLQVTYPSRVVIDGTTPDPVAVLLAALASGNEPQVVELCDVNLDLTGHSEVVLGNHVSLIASPGCARGPRNLGPLIFVRDSRADRSLFTVRGDFVRISGFRLEGPTKEVSTGGNSEKGIRIWPWSAPTPIHDIEVSNMEIFHWAGVGVVVSDNVAEAERGRLFNTNESTVRIVNNYIHDNRHDSEGYGAEVTGGAYALIAHNVFNQNRHSIAGGSRNKENKKDYSGYTARENLILAEGGYACTHHLLARLLIPFSFTGFCWQTHAIDMHGDGNRVTPDDWQCGTAGETILIERNTILYDEGLAIKIRGVPADKVVVDGNVFKHKQGKGIEQNGYCGARGDNINHPIDIRPNNVYGVDPRTELGECDFAGDGGLDDFMATGVTWWARSRTTGQWRYLNTMPERIPQLSLGRVDGDSVCDVASKVRKFYSKGGTGRWARLQLLPGAVGTTPLIPAVPPVQP